jgi:predicted RNase H-like HicB family nuclease
VTDQYFDRTNRPDAVAGGVRMIPITTPLGASNVWTKRIGNNPALMVLLLPGHPSDDVPRGYVIGLDGVITTGKTVDEIVENMREAIPFHLEGMHLNRDELPGPMPIVRTIHVASQL